MQTDIDCLDLEHPFLNYNVQLAYILIHISCWSTEGCSADNCTLHIYLKCLFLVTSELIQTQFLGYETYIELAIRFPQKGDKYLYRSKKNCQSVCVVDWEWQFGKPKPKLFTIRYLWWEVPGPKRDVPDLDPDSDNSLCRKHIQFCMLFFVPVHMYDYEIENIVQ